VNAYEQSTYVKCSECRNLFERGESESWKRRCLDCWKRSKSTEKASAPDPYAAGYAAGHAAGLADAARIAPAVGAIDKARLRQLLQLTHPDRHAGSALANEVTVWLLALRKGIE